jgi:ribosomal protein L33
MNKAKKKKKKNVRVYSTLKTGSHYYVRIPKTLDKNSKLIIRKYDPKARKHTEFTN